MEDQDDLDTELVKLVYQATECNIQRFHNVIKIKDILVESVGYSQSFVEQRMAFFEFDAKERSVSTIVYLDVPLELEKLEVTIK
ncbi:unnamed protein product [Trifolium pratense]|uniref:Uncharacterized protein n=1 Tax=Trifolium pratense TaxID=57577 RepID=A0ACB0JSG7_TRIPR|nr:unnamed protein product [Trifolium pratense]